MGNWKDITPEERAELVAIAINESGINVDTDSNDVATINPDGLRIIAEAIREAQEAVRKP